VPCAFISGITGQFFRQFAITIAVSTVISAFNSLTLSPALAALLLRPRSAPADWVTRLLNLTLGWFFRLFNRIFHVGTGVYVGVVGGLLRLSALVLVVYGGLLGLTAWSFEQVPLGFIPQQDQGWLLVNVQLPDSASVQRSQAIIRQAADIALQTKGVAHTVQVAGQSILLSVYGSNYASMFVVLDPFDKRRNAELRADAIAGRLRDEYRRHIRDAVVSVFGAPPVNGLGTASGFKLMVEDRSATGPRALQEATERLIVAGRKDPDVASIFSMYRADTPQLYADIDRSKVRSMGVPLKSVNDALEAYMGSVYVNNVNAFGRFWQVNVMADPTFRTTRAYLNRLKVRNAQGQMVPLGTVIDLHDKVGPAMVQRYNLYAAASVNGVPRPGVSTGNVIDAMDTMAHEQLPRTMSSEWTELILLQIRAGNTAMYVFALAVVFVFLVLAALYESWSLPLAVILVVPMCLLCSVAGVALAHLDINIFTQIGFVVLVGLASKNSILIVEFAKQLTDEGKPLREATLEACRLRLRPILMTSFAFIFGVVPLVIAKGAGAEMRQALGTAVFSGMIGVTLFGVLLTPVFFLVISKISNAPIFCSAEARVIGSGLSLLLTFATLGIFKLLPILVGQIRCRPVVRNAREQTGNQNRR
jgi:multidrug efflux pump